MGELWKDMRYGARMLRRSAGFTVIAIATLALGIGANTALFSIVNGVLLSPLPFPKPDQLMLLYEIRAKFPAASISYPNFLDWRRESQSFQDMAAFRDDGFTITGLGEAQRVDGMMISANLFSILGVPLVLGHGLDPDQDRKGGRPEVLISERLWREQLSGSRGVIGTALRVNGVAYTIAGVVPENFRLRMQNFRAGDVYVPIGQWNDPGFYQRNEAMGMDAVARLKPGVTLEQARADMQRVAANLAQAYPKDDSSVGALVRTMKETIVGDVRPYLLVLLAAVFFVLAIACVNVANLLLARSMARSREFAIRVAVGAPKIRVIRQLLTESVLLALAGGVAGLILAAWGVPAVLKLVGGSFSASAFPRIEEVRLDARVLIFTLAISLVCGILFGMAPALRTLQANPQKTLREGARGASAARSRLQSAFVVIEMALALVLLVGAGLMIRTLDHLWRVDPGFDPNHVMEFDVALPPRMIHGPAAQIRADLREIREEIAAVPGVSAVSLHHGTMPMGSDSDDPFWIAGQPKPEREAEMPWALWYQVEPAYFQVMRIPLLRGRLFTAQDNETSARVAVIDQSFAEKYFPGENPIGHAIEDEFLGQPYEIVGVVGHVKQWGLEDKLDLHAEFYIPFTQTPNEYMTRAAGDTEVLVRTQGEPLALLDAIRKKVVGGNNEEVVFDPHAYTEIVSRSVADRAFAMILLGVFAGLALILASVGVYGVVSYVVGQRTQEIGVRIALGAQRSDVLKLILGEGARTALIGVGIGLVAALGLTQLMSSVLYGVTVTDPLTFATVPVVLTAVALVACYLPARRAMRVDPLIALRYE